MRALSSMLHLQNADERAHRAGQIVLCGMAAPPRRDEPAIQWVERAFSAELTDCEVFIAHAVHEQLRDPDSELRRLADEILVAAAPIVTSALTDFMDAVEHDIADRRERLAADPTSVLRAAPAPADADR